MVPDATTLNAAPTITAPVALTINLAKTLSLAGQAITNVQGPGDPPPDSLLLNIHNMEDADPAFRLQGNAAISALINVNGNANIGGGGSSGALYGSIIADEITASGGKAVVNSSDITNYDDSLNAVKQALESFGDLHVVVNNAGVNRDRMFASMTEAELDRELSSRHINRAEPISNTCIN